MSECVFYSPSSDNQSSCELGKDEALRARYSNSTEDEMALESFNTCRATSPASWATHTHTHTHTGNLLYLRQNSTCKEKKKSCTGVFLLSIVSSFRLVKINNNPKHTFKCLFAGNYLLLIYILSIYCLLYCTYIFLSVYLDLNP